MKVDECVFGFFFAETTTNKMWNGIDVVFMHDGSTDTYRTWTLAHCFFLQKTVFAIDVDEFFAVVGHVDKLRFEFHERINTGVYGGDTFTFQWR